ncbi:MAG: Lactamase protein [Candidatus Poribacteria bacterium]|nr:Lactamase protein [Candidatus Poribacteria bacterium]MDQ1327882.1 Lactamase protein [Candidatus Poribacteria bacterium]
MNLFTNMENMTITILGSGGAMPTPRPFCQCKTCVKARKVGEPYKRNSCSLFVNDINTVIDCGEDIADSINRRDIKQVDSLFITHWHPDHTFGFRPILEANFDFRKNKPKRAIDVYIPKKVFETLKQSFPAIDYLLNTQKTGKLHLIEDEEIVKMGNILISVVGYKGINSDTYAYLIQQGEKKILYAPCDTISFNNYKNFHDLDLLINECGLFSNVSSEISFDDLMKRIKEINPKQTILTHVEEVEINIWGEEYLQKMKDKYSDIKFDFASDGMEIKI